MIRRLLIRLVLLALIGAVAVAAWLGYEYRQYRDAPILAASSDAPLRFDVRRGESGRALASTLQGVGVTVPDWKLALAWRLRGDGAQLKAGSYEFTQPLTLEGLLDQLVVGQPDKQRTLTLVDGLTFAQYRALLSNAPGLVAASAGLTGEQILQAIGSDQHHPEGWFAPDTYQYSEGSSDLDLLARAHALQKQRLAQAWDGRDPTLPLTSPYQLLTLASIVEKETGQEADRGLVAGVFTNRLRIGMMLQSDPTTIYGLGERFDGNLRRRDLRADTPYNTYTRNGLTPTPIAMPGRASLEAVAHPADTKALYFVARGDGSSHFSPDLDGHNRAVNRYQRPGQRPPPAPPAAPAVAGGSTTPTPNANSISNATPTPTSPATTTTTATPSPAGPTVPEPAPPPALPTPRATP